MQTAKASLSKEKTLQTLRLILLARGMDEKLAKLARQNMGGNFHLSAMGHEIVGIAAALAMRPGIDWALPYYRDRAVVLGLGVTPKELFTAFLARDGLHHSSGKQMPEHYSHKALRIPCQSSVVGSQMLQAAGLAYARKRLGTDEFVYVSFGDGATSQGDFHEAFNFASIHKLPVLFVIQDNGWAISVTKEEQTAGGSIAAVAKSYKGMRFFEVDGTDIFATSAAFQQAAEHLRNGKGPCTVLAHVPRIGAHSSSDDPKKYKRDQDLLSDLAKDPVPKCIASLIQEGLITEAEVEQLKSEVQALIDEEAEEAKLLPLAREESLTIFKEYNVEQILSCPLGDEPVVMMDAINHALHEEMERDANVVVFGQDVAKGKGGVFGITKGLTDRFGLDRCFNTPLAESTIVGISIGMSLDGFHKPVAEVQFADYLWTGINQLFNELSSIYYRSNGEWNCPVVLRMPTGGYIQGGPYHSQSIEAFLAHCPGLKIAYPSNAADAKRLLKAAIRDPNPVIILEHKALYRQRAFAAQIEPGIDDCLAFGQAKVLSEGTDLTLVTWGYVASMAAEVVDRLKREENASVELIDLRTIVPVDYETIRQSVKKTGKLLIAHEASEFCGFGAEIAAWASNELFTYLDAPVERLGAKHMPVPYAKELENIVLPQKEDLERKILNLLSF